MNTITFLAVLGLATAPIKGPVVVENARTEEGIRPVIEAFRASIQQKDKARFLALFAPGTVVWQSVRGDDSLRHVRQTQPGAAKLALNPGNSPQSFIDKIVESPARIDEVFRDVRIDTDGDIASVTFDFSFQRDGVEINRGREAWQLVHTDAGWRIIAVIWSTQLPAGPAGS
ncbi:nuclear transport factor 2 family protein [Tahibacter amnicola]|uniref:Nuclear transport factor 2 family protein n=1 Tax=Tahibacter amnicola TaxID=2976241 RepID=A0ABY6B9A0_9GAMM|nr:nuclear transport factor 2 family protein [Tahibacter amnicola]UXI66249.1 nuclear transport factor 2 family protein [Tahibacter amnicola]